MSFARPEFLWLLVAVVLATGALAGRARTRRRLHLPGGRPSRAETLAHGLFFLGGLTLLALAAAGPGFGVAPAAPAPGPGRLLLALDCSRSMLARDLRPDRLGAAKALARTVLARLPELPAGLVVFAGRARLACPVTRDRAGLLLFLDAASPADLPLGGTSLAAALEACRLALLGGEPGAVLLLSDGEETLAIPDAAGPAKDTPVLTVAVGGALPVGLPDERGGLATDNAGRPINLGLDAAGLAALAAGHQGEAFRLSPDGPDPAPAIADALEQRLPTRQGQPGPPRPRDRTTLCLGLGLALLLADLLFFPRVRRLAALLPLIVLSGGPVLAATDAATVLDQGLGAYAAGRYEEARQRFLAARARDPDAPEILFALGAADYRLGRYDGALAFFERAARTARGALRARALYNQGNAAFRLDDFSRAVTCYQAALELAPDDADTRANLALAQARLSGTSPAASASPQADQRSSPSPAAGTNPPAHQDAGEATGQASQDRATGQDQGATSRADPAQAAPPDILAADTPGPEAARQAVTAPQGRPGGVVRADAQATPDQEVLTRVPDLPGLPVGQPVLGLPRVERDW